MTALDRFRLDGQVAGSPGGARGVGRATAEAFTAAGARAVLVDRDLDEAKRAAAAIGKTEAYALDVTNEAEVDRFFDELAARTGHIDILVNNAGASIRKPSIELSKAEWDAVISVNQTAVFLCSRAAARHMLKDKRGGAIVNLASIMGFFSGRRGSDRRPPRSSPGLPSDGTAAPTFVAKRSSAPFPSRDTLAT